jgi:hypothetical protein
MFGTDVVLTFLDTGGHYPGDKFASYVRISPAAAKDQIFFFFLESVVSRLVGAFVRFGLFHSLNLVHCNMFKSLPIVIVLTD